MSSLWRVLVFGSAAIAVLLMLGFVVFANVVTSPVMEANPNGDAIVVLTGESARIAEGARLLDEGRAGRMLISGVFPRTGKKALLEISGLPEDKFDCCVDIDYAALDTVGNAQQTRNWAAAHGYNSVIVVTASYHMPRSLAELSLALPDVELIPHPVMPGSFPSSHWWLNTTVTRTLISEYLKFLPRAARLTMARLVRSASSSSVAKEAAESSSAGIF
ncbi:YdcF family protein [Hyphomicrobium sp. D-2]|uniref:YdcF family protein n=1 Tax=Hyphomicrobium sp. D-2 TaxID=3041621 RepID=UPI002454934B|nr:YdcF family protein [Hyphomicrobium sp. D-2]MDH4982471.1 YdcF family protein [Hyphomicrobium sp. D-2]